MKKKIGKRREIRKIESSLSEAVEWWSQEQVIGKIEKNTVLLLLILENKIDKREEVINAKEFWQECEVSISIPEEIRNEVFDLCNK